MTQNLFLCQIQTRKSKLIVSGYYGTSSTFFGTNYRVRLWILHDLSLSLTCAWIYQPNPSKVRYYMYPIHPLTWGESHTCVPPSCEKVDEFIQFMIDFYPFKASGSIFQSSLQLWQLQAFGLYMSWISRLYFNCNCTESLPKLVWSWSNLCEYIVMQETVNFSLINLQTYPYFQMGLAHKKLRSMVGFWIWWNFWAHRVLSLAFHIFFLHESQLYLPIAILLALFHICTTVIFPLCIITWISTK